MSSHSTIIYQDAATATMIITMRSHQTNHCEDICDDDHMLLTAPAALDAANYTMFVTHPFSVMTHNSNQKYVDVYLSSIFSIVLSLLGNQTVLISVQFGFSKLILCLHSQFMSYVELE